MYCKGHESLAQEQDIYNGVSHCSKPAGSIESQVH